VSRKVEQGQATRQQLVGIATKLFAKHGYDGTSIEAVLTASKMSRGALYHHFASKEALFEAVLEDVETGIAETIVRSARRATDPVGVLRAGCKAWLRIAEDPAAHQIALVDAPAVVGWQRWREIDGRHAFGLLKGALQAVAATGRLRTDVVDVLAHMLLAAMLEVALVIARAPDRKAALQNGERAVDELLDRLVGAGA
jgi:AcrR family transcriptional regulator